jgi:hypothetical protein
VDITVTTPGGTSATGASDQFTYVTPAPTVTAVSPTSGTTLGGTSVTITGTNLTGATAVKFGASSAALFTVNSASSITASSPTGSAGAVDITVTTPGGTSATGASDQFTYVTPAPTVTAISPASGTTLGGTSVTVTGTNLTGATAVKFGATNATSFTVNSASSITASAPAGSAGAVDITVTTPGGTSATGASDQFTYVTPAPTVTAISPASGTTLGGTSVTITGTNLTGATAVKFGASNATSFTVNSASSITASTPAGSAGAVDITVTTPGGTSATGASDQFTYVTPAPTVTAISPASGTTLGGTSVTITGTNLNGATAVKFGASSAASFTVNSASSITAPSPAGSAGAVDITVTTPGGTSATGASDQFTYVTPAPTVTAVSPASGTTLGGTSVTITGTNLTGATAVKFGASNATSFTVNSASSITASAPAGSAGTVDITVTTPGGTSATGASDQFTYVTPAPTVTAVSPASGTTLGGTSVTITGTNLTGATAVKFGASNAASFTVNSASSITASSPAGSAGAVDITVTTPGGTSATGASDQFTYVTPAPTVTAISPASGTTLGGTSVTITGTNLNGATAVKFGASNAASFTVNSASSITASSPAGSAGAVDITVTTPGGTSATSASDQFTYVTPAPTVTAISPASGTTTGGTSVTITGTNFTGATAVTIGGTAATGITVVNAATITATTPAHAAGAADVVVTTPAGGGTGTALFTYLSLAPTVAAVSPASGLTAGGGTVTITGSNFTGVTAVTFGVVAAASFTVVNATTITATVPSHLQGAVGVSVSAAGGSGTMTSAYTYVTGTPAIASVTPSSGPTTGGTTVTIAGSNLTGATAVTFGGAAATSFTVISATAITAVTPQHVLGAVDVAVAAPGGMATAASAFSYATPTDSAHLRSLQVGLTKMVAQTSGQATSSAIDDAIADGFSDSDQLVSQSSSGLRVNFAAEPRQRIDGAFQALTDAKTARAPLPPEPKVWLPWIEVAGTNWKTSLQTGDIRGGQFNALAGLTGRLSPNLVVGAFGGYENFDYSSQTLSGRLRGAGWTVGSYAGWIFMPGLRFDLGLAYSRVNFDGTAGTAEGSFPGERWLGSMGLTGTYKLDQFTLEPSARVFTLFEHEDAYLDSLGTAQAQRSFSSGRASTGVKVEYTGAQFDGFKLLPFVGLYGDYYFTGDDATATIGTPDAIASGWSARVSSGVAINWASGPTLLFGTELGGLGSNRFLTLSGRGRLSVPF